MKGKTMTNLLQKIFGIREEKVCNHDKNYRKLKFFAPDGTPMIDFACHDCGYKDEGHVYADVKDWENNLIIACQGKIIINEHGKGR